MIRELRNEDIPALMELFEELAPQWIHDESQFRHRLATSPARVRRRNWVAEEDGDIVASAGSGFVIHSDRKDVAWIDLAVKKKRRREGLGTELFAVAEQHVVGVGARRILAGSADLPESRRFLETRGFTLLSEQRVSAIDPRDVDFSQFDGFAAVAGKDGFALSPFAEFADRPELIHAVDEAVAPDIPLDEPITQIPFEEWHSVYWRNPLLSMHGSYAVVHRGRPVAIAFLRAHLPSRKAQNDLTGTLREYRGRGLARLVKLASLRWAVEHGITQVTTGNDEKNAPMLAVNVGLGYKPFAAELSWGRE